MNKLLCALVIALCSLPFFLSSQQTAYVVSQCGGMDTVTIPTITDNDHDGMDDVLEQRLIDYFMPTIIQFDNESCAGPALDGTGDSNLVVCHIYPYPQQYTRSASLDSVLTHPVAVVPKKGLVTGLTWYPPLIKVNAALLYGKDCGLAGHTSDVEGFNYSIKYVGPDTVTGWMYDTVMQHWMGGTIQTISHEGTLCEQIETHPYKSALFPTGLDTVYASPDKHGNYLTIGGCGASFICNPGCGGIPSRKNVRGINLGEPNATLVTDLGNVYPAYAGNDPWSTNNFLSAQGGNAGAIRTKMILAPTSDFFKGTVLSSHAQICAIYSQCFSTGYAYLDYSCNGSAYNFFGQQLTTSGTYYHTLTSSYGCDSTIALSLSVVYPSANSYSAAICNGDLYNFNGAQLIASGVYHDTLVNSSGCDSVVTLNLTVNPASQYSFSASVCSGNTYSFNGQQLTSAGIYTDTTVNSSGCLNIVQLTLTVDALPAVSWNLNGDTILSENHPVLLSGGTPVGGIYSGPGVYGNIFFPDSAGAGSHLITYTYTDVNGCSSVATQSLTVLVSGINEVDEFANSVLVYPNPVHEKLTLVLPATGETFGLSLFDAKGTEVKNLRIKDNYASIDVSDLPAGIYSLQLRSKTHLVIKKLVIE